MNISDFAREDGSADWDAYHKHQVDKGDKCMTCGGYLLNIGIFRKPTPGPKDCIDCRDIKGSGDEVTHSQYVRCPNCKFVWNPGECDDYGFFRGGEHDAYCGECDHQFTIDTHVTFTFTFTSPALSQEDTDNE